MKRRLLIIPAMAMLALGLAGVADAHRCDEGPDGTEENCEETPVMPNWRDGNYVPLFDIDRDDEQERYNAQRWRDECGSYDGYGNYQGQQFCIWQEFGTSVLPNPDQGQPEPAPNEVHVGAAGSHCFLSEAQHQCEDHSTTDPEGTHDAHGGAAYADVCATANPESKYCNDGPQDTQAGVTIMDHNRCGVIVPIAACTDEYHVVRPLNPEFTQWQMEQSAVYIQTIIDDPELYLCGYKQYGSSNPICPTSGDGPLPGDGGPDVATPGAPADATVASPARAVALRAEAVRMLLDAGVNPELIELAQTRAASTGTTTTTTTSFAMVLAGLAALLGRRVRGLMLSR